MTAPEQLIFKTLIFHGHSADALGLPEYRLLNELGHDVSTTDSTGQARELLLNDRGDLVVIDTDRSGQHEFVSCLSALPADQQPRQVAIFCDGVDESLAALLNGMKRSQVHVLIKPLHLHGLLGILRKIEARA